MYKLLTQISRAITTVPVDVESHALLDRIYFEGQGIE